MKTKELGRIIDEEVLHYDLCWVQHNSIVTLSATIGIFGCLYLLGQGSLDAGSFWFLPDSFVGPGWADCKKVLWTLDLAPGKREIPPFPFPSTWLERSNMCGHVTRPVISAHPQVLFCLLPSSCIPFSLSSRLVSSTPFHYCSPGCTCSPIDQSWHKGASKQFARSNWRDLAFVLAMSLMSYGF